jgi:hypothetical protein
LQVQLAVVSKQLNALIKPEPLQNPGAFKSAMQYVLRPTVSKYLWSTDQREYRIAMVFISPLLFNAAKIRHSGQQPKPHGFGKDDQQQTQLLYIKGIIFYFKYLMMLVAATKSPAV